jgi:hypothetical protein
LKTICLNIFLALASLALVASLVEIVNPVQHYSSLVVSLKMLSLIQVQHVAQFTLILLNKELSKSKSVSGLSKSSIVPVSQLTSKLI